MEVRVLEWSTSGEHVKLRHAGGAESWEYVDGIFLVEKLK